MAYSPQTKLNTTNEPIIDPLNTLHDTKLEDFTKNLSSFTHENSNAPTLTNQNDTPVVHDYSSRDDLQNKHELSDYAYSNAERGLEVTPFVYSNDESTSRGVSLDIFSQVQSPVREKMQEEYPQLTKSDSNESLTSSTVIEEPKTLYFRDYMALLHTSHADSRHVREEDSSSIFKHNNVASPNFFSPCSPNIRFKSNFDLSLIQPQTLTRTVPFVIIKTPRPHQLLTSPSENPVIVNQQPSQVLPANEPKRRRSNRRREDDLQCPIAETPSPTKLRCLNNTRVCNLQEQTTRRPTPQIINNPSSIEHSRDFHYNDLLSRYPGIPAGREPGSRFDDEPVMMPPPLSSPNSISNGHIKPRACKKKAPTTPLSEAQTNVSTGVSLVSSDTSISTVKSASAKLRPERNYVSVYKNGIIDMLDEGRIGQFFETWEGRGRVTREEEVDYIKQQFNGVKTVTALIGKVRERERENLNQPITSKTSKLTIKKIAMGRIVAEFFYEDIYEYWVNNVYKPHGREEEGGTMVFDEATNKMKRQQYWEKRGKLGDKFKKCFKKATEDKKKDTDTKKNTKRRE